MTVPASGPAGRPAPSLSVTRCFGDTDLAAAGVVPRPDVAVFPRRAPWPGAAPAPAQVLILASDGLWEVVSNEEAVGLAAAAPSAEAASEALLAAARARWADRLGSAFADDVTVITAFL